MAKARKLAVALLLGTGLPAGVAQAATPHDSCEALVGLTLWPGVAITSAKRVAEAPPNTVRLAPQIPATTPVALPAHCLAQGMIDPHTGADGTRYGLEFQLALPDDWNGRFLFQGGGGMNGSLNPPLGAAAAGARPALARGFAGRPQGRGVRSLVHGRSARRARFLRALGRPCRFRRAGDRRPLLRTRR